GATCNCRSPAMESEMVGRSRKARRMLTIGGGGAVLCLAIGLVLVALREDIVFFQSPSDILRNGAQGTQIRLGGMVENDSVVRSHDGLQVSFHVTDGANSVPVSYSGILPDLFREGQGVVVDGTMH